VDFNGLRIEQFDCSEKDYQLFRKKRGQALRAIKEMKFFPFWTEIEKVSGIAERKARYGYQVVMGAVKESFHNDSFWG